MRTGKVVWGIVLVAIGTIIMLNNFGVIHFYWSAIWHYWPAILILIGLNMLFSRSNSSAGTIIPIAGTCIVLLLLIYAGVNYDHSGNTRSYDRAERMQDGRELKMYAFREDFTAGTQNAELNIEGGASSYSIIDSTSRLFEAKVKDVPGVYSMNRVARNGTEVLNFGMKGRSREWDMDDNSVQMFLNTVPVWDVNVKIGAGSVDLDLSKFRIQKLSFEGGAASCKAKLGMPQGTTDVIVKIGASSVEILIPESAACKIKVNSGLSSKDFPGFTEQPDGTYTTSNFNSSAKRIMINLKGGLSSFEVRRY